MAPPRKPSALPPEYLTDEDLLRIADTRREVWRGGLTGLGAGLGAGYAVSASAGWWGGKILKVKRELVPLPSSWRGMIARLAYGPPKYKMLFTLLAGAAASFTLAYKRGSDAMIHMGDVWKRGGSDQVLTEYQRKNVEAGGGLRARERELEIERDASFRRRMEALRKRKKQEPEP